MTAAFKDRAVHPISDPECAAGPCSWMVPIGLMVLGTVILFAIYFMPEPGESAVLVFAPGVSSAEGFANTVRAGWLPVRTLSNGALLAHPGADASGSTPGDVWLMIDGQALKGCPFIDL